MTESAAPRFGRRAVVRVRWVGMVVTFVCVIRVPVCPRVSRVRPGSPRRVFLPVHCVSRLPPMEDAGGRHRGSRACLPLACTMVAREKVSNAGAKLNWIGLQRGAQLHPHGAHLPVRRVTTV